MGKRIEWKGGECPVSLDTIINVFLRNGDQFNNEMAGDWTWFHGYGQDDIIAYEVIEESKEDKPEKTLWDEYAIEWMKVMDWRGMTVNDASHECAEMANAMMKARAK